MARPKKDPDDVMGQPLKIMVTPDQKELIREAARADGSSNMSEWSRQVLLQAARERTDTRKRKR